MRQFLFFIIGMFLIFLINGLIPKSERAMHLCMLGTAIWFIGWGAITALRGLYRFMVR